MVKRWARISTAALILERGYINLYFQKISKHIINHTLMSSFILHERFHNTA